MNQPKKQAQALHGLFSRTARLDQALLCLARNEPEVHAGLRQVGKSAAKWKTLPKGWTQKSVNKFWETLTGGAKHKVTKCIEKMKDKFKDPGAFCASLADKVEGPEWRSRQAAASSEITRAVAEFVKFAQKTINNYHKKNSPNVEPPQLSVTWGKRYARIVENKQPGNRSVFGFVDMDNGDILKAASWKKPARHARGNVLDKSSWKGSHGPFGMSYMRAAGQKTAGQVAKTIAEQMGGVGRLKAMLGAQVTALSGDKGLGIKWPNKQRSKGNYVEIVYDRGQDLYDMTFYNKTTRAQKKVKEFRGVFADQLGDLFEKQTGWYLRLASRVAARYLKRAVKAQR